MSQKIKQRRLEKVEKPVEVKVEETPIVKLKKAGIALLDKLKGK